MVQNVMRSNDELTVRIRWPNQRRLARIRRGNGPQIIRCRAVLKHVAKDQMQELNQREVASYFKWSRLYQFVRNKWR